VAADAGTQTLNHDLREWNLSEQVVPYTNKLVCQAVIEWLVATNPIAPLCHLSLDRKLMLTCTVDLDGNYRAMPCIFTVQ